MTIQVIYELNNLTQAFNIRIAEYWSNSVLEYWKKKKSFGHYSTAAALQYTSDLWNTL